MLLKCTRKIYYLGFSKTLLIGFEDRPRHRVVIIIVLVFHFVFSFLFLSFKTCIMGHKHLTYIFLSRVACRDPSW